MALDIGVVLQTNPPAFDVVAQAVRADELGFSHVWTFDSHVLWQEPYVIYSQILGRTDYAYTVFQHPKQIAWMWRDGGWEPQQVADHFDQVLGQHLQHVGMVMPSGMGYSNET